MIQFRLDGQTAVVTGASRGIGRAVALALGQAGAKVIGTATTDEGAAAISEALRAEGIAGEGMRLDVTDAAAAAAFDDSLQSWVINDGESDHRVVCLDAFSPSDDEDADLD